MAEGYAMNSMLKSMSDGDFFKRVVAWVLRIAGVGGAVTAVAVAILSVIGGFEVGVLDGIGGIVFGAFLIAAAAASMQICLYRADRTQDLPGTRYSVLSVFTQLLRAVGEVSVVIGVAGGIGGCLNAWIADGFAPLGFIGFTPGILFFALSVASGFVMLFANYFIAEGVNLFVNIANDQHRLTLASDTPEMASERTAVGAGR